MLSRPPSRRCDGEVAVSAAEDGVVEDGDGAVEVGDGASAVDCLPARSSAERLPLPITAMDTATLTTGTDMAIRIMATAMVIPAMVIIGVGAAGNKAKLLNALS